MLNRLFHARAWFWLFAPLLFTAGLAWAQDEIESVEPEVATVQPVGFSLRIAADEPMAGLLEDCLDQELAQRPELIRDDQAFRYFLSLVAMPIVQDKNGLVLGYSISTLVLSPLDTSDIISHMVAGAREDVAPLLARAHNVLDWKLYIIKPQNLPSQCQQMAQDMGTAIAAEEARLKSLNPAAQE